MTLLQDLNTMFLLMKTYFSSFPARGKSTDRPPRCVLMCSFITSSYRKELLLCGHWVLTGVAFRQFHTKQAELKRSKYNVH